MRKKVILLALSFQILLLGALQPLFAEVNQPLAIG